MKLRRKLVSAILAMTLLCSNVLPVMATDATTGTGSIPTSATENVTDEQSQTEKEKQFEELVTEETTVQEKSQEEQQGETQAATEGQEEQQGETQAATEGQEEQQGETQAATEGQEEQQGETQAVTEGQEEQQGETQVVTEGQEEQQEETQAVTNPQGELVQPIQNELLSENEITWNDKGEFPFITEVKISDENGVDIGESSFDRNQKINLDFYFAIPNDAVVSVGDMYTIPIPEGFELVGNLPEQQLDEASGIDVTWQLTDNIITIRFYQSLDVISDVSGFMSIGCWFDKDSQLGQGGQDITFEIAGQTYTIDVYEDPITEAVSAEIVKQGTYDQSTKQVTWTLVVTPDSSNATLEGVTVRDYYDTSIMTFVSGSFTVNGQAIADDNVIFNADGFEYKFPDGTNPGTKTITYKTTLADSYYLSEATTVVNNVSTYMPNGDKSSEAEAEITVNKLPMQKTLVKYNPITKRASWQIVANRNKLSLQNVTIIDQYPKGSYIDTDTIKVNGQSTTNYQDDTDTNTLTIDLGNIDYEVTITYDMVITDFSQFTTDGETYHVTNYSSLNSESSIIEDVTGEGWIGVGTGNIPISKSGSVRVDQTYGQYIQWWIEINNSNSTDYKEITEPIVFYDKLPDGTSMIPWNMTITAYFPDGTSATNSIPYEDVYDARTNTVSYTITPGMVFGGKETTPDCSYGIWFATSIDGIQEGSYKNTAQVTVGEQTNEDTATVDVSYKTEDWIVKSGSYNYQDNTYDWTIRFNKGNQAALNPVITDTLPEGHIPAYDYIYVGDQQVQLDGTPNGVYSATYNADSNVITVSAKGYVLSETYIKVSTKYAGEGTQGNATNNVELKGDNFSHSFTATATVNYKPLPILEKKTNYTSGDTITWEVVINLDHDNLGQLSLVDQLSPGLSFDPSSVKLYIAQISSNGTVTSTETEVSIADNDIQYEDTTGLITIYLPENLDTHQCYVLKFDTDIQDKTLTTVTNSINFYGTDFEEGTTSQTVILKTTSSSSGIIGRAGSIKIKKLDKTTNMPMEGVAFQLLNSDKEPITSAGWATTNADGIAEFEDWLRLDTLYYIQEVRTLAGYVFDDTLYEVKVNSSSQSDVV